MKCAPERLSAFADGDLSPRRAAQVEAHLASCGACRRQLDALRLLRAALAAEPDAIGDAPDGNGEAPDRWGQLVQQLAVPAPVRRPWRRWVLAPAFATVAAVALWLHPRPHGQSDDAVIAEAEGEFRNAEAQYLHAIDRLRTVTLRAQASWAPPRRHQYELAQAALEQATDQCRGVARVRPADVDAEELLFAAYRKQIHFYEEQLLRGEPTR